MEGVPPPTRSCRPEPVCDGIVTTISRTPLTVPSHHSGVIDLDEMFAHLGDSGSGPAGCRTCHPGLGRRSHQPLHAGTERTPFGTKLFSLIGVVQGSVMSGTEGASQQGCSAAGSVVLADECDVLASWDCH